MYVYNQLILFAVGSPSRRNPEVNEQGSDQTEHRYYRLFPDICRSRRAIEI